MNWLKLFICGIFIGTADLVPGISGGTMAFILGVYEDLLLHISSIKLSSFFRKRKIASIGSLKFLFPILSGIAVSFIFFAHWIQAILQHELYKLYLYAGFLGLVLASIFFCSRQIKKWNFFYLTALFIGACLGFILTSNIHLSMQQEPSYIWLILYGMIAITAMLLPGVSGSYMLTILGVYPLAIGALVDFVSALRSLSWNWHAFTFLCYLGIGIVLGALIFSRCVNWLLAEYRNLTIAALTGFMIGALRSVWPFTIPLLTQFSPFFFWISCSCTVVGFAFVFLVEWIASRNRKKYVEEH